MYKHRKYASYVLRHKFHVFIASYQLGVPWLGLIHDLSKLRPSEWFPYANFFYGKKQTESELLSGMGFSKEEAERIKKVGWHKPTETNDKKYDLAWFLHLRRNKHHWQYWIIPNDNDGVKAMQIPEKYIREMVSDWKGAGKALHHPDDILWYNTNKDKMVIHPDSRKRIEKLLGVT